METMKQCSTCGTAFSGKVCPKCMADFVQKPTHVIGPEEDGPLRPGQKFHGLEVIELLGKGGMGVVYKARQPALNRFVALKLLPQNLAQDPDFQARFQREAQALATLSHPNIVSVYDFGAEGNLFFFVMEFVDGINLRQSLREKRLPPEEAFRIVPQLCDALQYAHGEGVVHRDIKPENILIDKKGRIKIADFGLAKLSGQGPGAASLTGTDVVMGTPRYMAPEQFESSKTVDHRADIYSMGVVFYEMLTGEVPMGRFDPPSKKVEVDIRIDKVVLKALEREPERRYQSAIQVRADIQEATGGPDPRSSAPTGVTAKPQGKLRRIALAGGLAAAVVLTIVFMILTNSGENPTPPSIPPEVKGGEGPAEVRQGPGERQDLLGRMKELESLIENKRLKNPPRALAHAHELRELAIEAKDKDFEKRATELVRICEKYSSDAFQLKQRAEELLKLKKTREAALLIDRLLVDFPGTQAAKGALYAIEIVTRPSGVRVTNARSDLLIGVTGNEPLIYRMKPGEVVRLRFEKAGYRPVTRDVKDKTLGRMVVDLKE